MKIGMALCLPVLLMLVSGCAPHGWRQYVAANGTERDAQEAYNECRDTGPYAHTVRLLYAFEYQTSQYDCMREKGFKIRR